MTTNVLELNQKRILFSQKSTISEVYNANTSEFVCYFLEDRDRGLLQSMTLEQAKKIKIDKQTCIPYGKFEIDITLSGRFGVWLPLLLNVLAFGGIRQHKGNTDADTEGCQLPGSKKSVDAVNDSTGAFNKLMLLYLTHLTLNSAVALQLLVLHKKGVDGAKEFGELFTKHRVNGQKIFITIAK